LFLPESRVIAECNIQKSKTSTNHGEIVAEGGCLAQKVVAFFFFEFQNLAQSPKLLRLHYPSSLKKISDDSCSLQSAEN
jgi:hypothetical protein